MPRRANRAERRRVLPADDTVDCTGHRANGQLRDSVRFAIDSGFQPVDQTATLFTDTFDSFDVRSVVNESDVVDGGGFWQYDIEIVPELCHAEPSDERFRALRPLGMP